MFLVDAVTCIPFFLLITFVANFMVFNLFVAILLEAFNVENLNEKGVESKVNEKKSVIIQRGIEHFSEMLKEKKRTIRNSFRKNKDEGAVTVNNINGGHPALEITLDEVCIIIDRVNPLTPTLFYLGRHC